MRFRKAIDAMTSIDAMRGKNKGEFTSLDAPGSFRARGGDDTVIGSDGNDRIWGGDDDDILFGDTAFGDGNDRIWGDKGDDLLLGRGGRDRLWGGDGRDEVAGEDGADKLYGGRGNDFLFDGAGRDVMYGGKGGDLFHMSEISGRGNKVKDFENGKDRVLIDFEGVDMGDVKIRKKPGGVEVSIKGENDNLLLEDVRRGQIDDRDFVFGGDDMG